MNNLEVINAFLKGREGKTPLREINGAFGIYEGRTLQTLGDKLINYSTKIAYKEGGILFVTNRKYSRTTSKIVSQLINEARKQNYFIELADF